MRSDIAKVVVERPRTGGGGAPGKNHRRAGDWKRLKEECRTEESITRETIRGKWREGFSGKSLNDFLSPVRGFLRKSLGRRWDDVYSEISTFLKPTSVMQRHVLEHVRDYVRTDIVSDEHGHLVDSKGCHVRVSYYRQAPTFYVRPADGTLQLASHMTPDPAVMVVPRREIGWGLARRRKAYDPFDRDEIPNIDKKYHKKDGIWYRLEFSIVPIEGPSSKWIVNGKLVSYEDLCQLRRQDNLQTFMACPGFATLPVYDVWEKRRTDSRVVAQDEYWKAKAGKLERFSTYGRHWRSGGLLYCSAKIQVGKREKKREGLV